MQHNVIAIAGLPGSGKSTLLKALQLAPELSTWKTVSTGTLLRERHAELANSSLFAGTFIEYLESLTDDEIRVLNERARALAEKGTFILDSRYAVKNCANVKNPLLIFLTAPLEVRVARLKKAHPHKTEQEIQNDFNKREAWEHERGTRIYAYDYRDAAHYGLVIDSSKYTIEEEVALIVEKLTA